LLNATPSCLKIITDKGQLLHMNPQGLSLIEAADLNSVLGADVYEIVEESHRKNFTEFNERICAGQKGELVFEIVGLEGTRRWMESYAAPFKLTSGEVAHLAITNDITKKIQAENEITQQRHALASSARLASLGQFVGGIAHEINNPLAVILGKLTLLDMQLQRDAFDKAMFQEELGTVIGTTERITNIINNLKTFSRNAKDDKREVCPLQDLVDETLSLCKENFRLNNIALEVEVDPGIECQCQSVRLSQVLMNLVNNSLDAVKSLDEKWLRIEGRYNGPMVELVVTDSGGGIPAVVADQMLDPFFTTKAVGHGTGLGLSISSGLLIEHGGRLRFNQDHANTQFIVELPRAGSEST
jgi:C4-dicarboxylate-specific signal transduction histidine kinase